jgi:hypothetical protein
MYKFKPEDIGKEIRLIEPVKTWEPNGWYTLTWKLPVWKNIDSVTGHMPTIAHQENCRECIDKAKEEHDELSDYIDDMTRMTRRAFYNRPRNEEIYPQI